MSSLHPLPFPSLVPPPPLPYSHPRLPPSLSPSQAVRVEFDPRVISYTDLLILFFEKHSPFSPAYSRQYRSAILVHDEAQRLTAKSLCDKIASSSTRKLHTSIEPAGDFYYAEEYHQKYIAKQGGRGRY